MNLTPATYKIIYNNVNITKDISDHLVSLSYADKVEGESDELEITLEDADLLWQNSWYPKKGARLEAQIEQDGLVLNCGAFTIDEIQLTSDRGSGDTVTIRGLAAGITKSIRTKKSVAHENKNLREICNSVAAANGLTVQGTIDNITIDRITQFEKTDLGFLKQLAGDFGYTFSIRDNLIVFTSIFELEARPHILSIDKTDLINWSLTDKTAETYKSVNVKYHNPKTNQLIDSSLDEDIDSGDEESSVSTNTNVRHLQYSKAAVNELSYVVEKVIIPALSKRNEELLKRVPALATAKILSSLKTIAGSANDEQIKQKCLTARNKLTSFIKACEDGNFNFVTAYGNNLAVIVRSFSTLVNAKIHSGAKNDVLQIRSKSENKQQAEAKAKAALHKKNSVECDGSVSLPGNTLLIAGNNFELTGMGTLSGINHILTSTHTIDRGGGYIVAADVKRIKTIPAAKHKPKAVKVKSKGFKNSNERAPDYSWGLSYGQPIPHALLTK